MKIKNIFFDLDGTLINSSRGIKYSMGQALSSVIPGFSVEQISTSLIGPPVPEMFRQIVGSHDANLIANLTREFRKSYDSEGWQKTNVYKGVIETLYQFYQFNITMFIVTNKPSKPTFKILHHLQMLQFFTEIVSPDTVTPPHPSKSAICEQILTGYQLDRQYAILVGDSCDDANAAKSCGLTFIAAAYGYGKVHESEIFEQSCKISSFPELMSLIKN
jgi:phosphoglycolate phosphatase